MKNINTIEYLDSNKCSGCGACNNICPKNAITMQASAEGFLEPVINKELCIDCGLCKTICPSLHRDLSNSISPKSYAVTTSPENMKLSTSAGLFGLVADYVLANNGYVCGAVYNEDFSVHHIVTNDPKEVLRMRKSKYVQSNTELVYREIRSLLDTNVPVLFSGCPCQVAGLKSFLRKDYPNLITMDIICHGTPSPGNWLKYLTENINTNQLLDVDFRHKGNHGFKKLYIAFSYKDGSEVIEPSGKNPYYLHFLKDIGLRKSCSECAYCTFPRIGDLSIGDWWGALNICPEIINNDAGLSILLLNTQKGEELFNKLKPSFEILKELSLSEAMSRNRNSIKRKAHPNRAEFFNRLQTSSFKDAVTKSLRLHYDVMIYGSTVNTNYGALITYYALYKAVERLGYSVILCNKPKKDNATEYEINNHATRFCEKRLNLTESKRFSKYSEYNELADTFLLGSDQIWNYKLFSGRKETFYLDFVSDDKKKISYASSFGFDKLTLTQYFPERFPKVKSLMKRLDFISVRESDGVKLCNDSFNVPAQFVMDPVFLLNANDYSELADDAVKKETGPYMTSYYLTPSHEKNNFLNYVAGQTGLKMVNMITGNPARYEKCIHEFDMPVCDNLEMEEWLYNIKNSELVVTDSYHCLCFSIIFRKRFILLQNKWAPSRIVSLLTKLNLMDRWIKTTDEIYDRPELLSNSIDYDSVYTILQKEIFNSYCWLENALKKDKFVNIYSGAFPKHITNNLQTITNIVDYFNTFSENKEKYVLMMLNNGPHTSYIDKITFFKGSDLGHVSKEKMKKGFSYIYDFETKTIKKKFSHFCDDIYYYKDICFSITSETVDTYTKQPISEFCIETSTSREIHRCSEDGVYILVYSKKDKQIADIVRVDVNQEDLPLFHM